MNNNVLDGRIYSLMKRIDWRQAQDRVMSKDESRRMNADSVRMLSYIAALDWFMFYLRDDLESCGMYRHGIKRTMNIWTDKICRMYTMLLISY